MATLYVGPSGVTAYASATSHLSPMSYATAVTSGVAGDILLFLPGAYTDSTSRTGVAGTTANAITWWGCNSSGVPLTVTYNADGTPDETDWPIITFTGTGRLTTGTNYSIYAIKFIHSITSSSPLTLTGAESCLAECIVENLATAGGTYGVTPAGGSRVYIVGCELNMASASTSGGVVVTLSGAGAIADGNLITGAISGTTGVNISSSTFMMNNRIARCATGIASTSTAAGVGPNQCYNTITGCGSAANIPAWVVPSRCIGNMITDNTNGYGGGLAALIVSSCRTRDTGSPLFSGTNDWTVNSQFNHVSTDTGGPETDYNNFATLDYRLDFDSPAKRVLPHGWSIGYSQPVAAVASALLVGSSTGTSLATATATLHARLVGSSTGTSLASAALQGIAALVGSSTGTSLASGTATQQASLVGSSTGTSLASATLQGIATLTGTITGTSLASAALTGLATLTGTATGTSSTTGALEAFYALVGTATGDSSATASITAQALLSGTSTGSSVATALLSGFLYASGTITGTSSATGALEAYIALIGSSTGTSSATAALTGLASISGTSTGTSSTTANLSGTLQAVGTATGTSSASGTLQAFFGLSGTAAGTSSTTGALSATASLVGSSTGTSETAAVLTALASMSGSANGTATLEGSITMAASLVGSSTGTSSTTGALSAVARLAGVITASSEVQAALTAIASLVGSSTGTSSAFIDMSVLMSGTAFGTSSMTGTLTSIVLLQGTAEGTSDATATLSALINLAGTATGTSSATGFLLRINPSMAPEDVAKRAVMENFMASGYMQFFLEPKTIYLPDETIHGDTRAVLEKLQARMARRPDIRTVWFDFQKRRVQVSAADISYMLALYDAKAPSVWG